MTRAVRWSTKCVGDPGIEPGTSFLYHPSDISRKMIMWVRMESNHVPLSYQESVLPVNYAPFFILRERRNALYH